jgi:hypothetical protein
MLLAPRELLDLALDPLKPPLPPPNPLALLLLLGMSRPPILSPPPAWRLPVLAEGRLPALPVPPAARFPALAPPARFAPVDGCWRADAWRELSESPLAVPPYLFAVALFA